MDRQMTLGNRRTRGVISLVLLTCGLAIAAGAFATSHAGAAQAKKPKVCIKVKPKSLKFVADVGGFAKDKAAVITNKCKVTVEFDGDDSNYDGGAFDRDVGGAGPLDCGDVPVTLTPKESCVVLIGFSAPADGPFAGFFGLVSSGSGMTVEVALFGAGID
jgi:hypothetical protein